MCRIYPQASFCASSHEGVGDLGAAPNWGTNPARNRVATAHARLDLSESDFWRRTTHASESLTYTMT